MFNSILQSGKYSPPRYRSVIVPSAVVIVGRSPILQRATKGSDDIPGELSPPPSAKMRHSKSKGVKAVKRHSSPQSRSLDNIEAVWKENKPEYSSCPSFKRSETTPSTEQGPNTSENGCPGPRNKKKGFRPPDVRTIFTPCQRDPRVKEERGEGHTFCPGASSAWCDVCCEYIIHNSLMCTGCKYTCHPGCRDKVSLDCQPAGAAGLDTPPTTLNQDHLNNNHSSLTDVEKERELRTHLSREEIKAKVDTYNASTTDHLKMTLNASGVYTGFIKVQLDLRRPVTVRGCQGAGSGGEEAFYLPRGSNNTLHISSNNTVQQVIQALLCKFTVADNPAKYALYKRFKREEQVYVCKLAEGEQPLFLRLVAGPNTDTLSFVLREQQTGEVMWDAFSIPELRNFLRILQKEEEEQMGTVKRRYDNYRQRLQEALTVVGGPT